MTPSGMPIDAENSNARPASRAEIAAQQSADPMQILHDDRLIEPEFSFQIGFVGRVDVSGSGKQDVDNIARDDAQQEKDDDRDPEQGHEHQCEAPYDISKHLVAPVSVHSAKVDTGCAIGARASHQAGCEAYPGLWCSRLLIQPHILVAIAVIRAVHHDGDALDVRLPARALAAVEDDRAGDVFLKLLVDFPNQLLALGDVGLLGLLVEQLLDVLVAIVGVVPFGIAGVVLIERLVRIVDRVSGEIEPERVVLARNCREPIGGFDVSKFAVDIDALELIDQDDGRLRVNRNIARRDLDLQVLVRAVARFLHQFACFLPAGFHVRPVARYRLQHFLWHGPQATRCGKHRGADIRLTFEEDGDERRAIQRQRHRAANIQIVKRRRGRVDDDIGADVDRLDDTYRVGRLRLDVLEKWNRYLGRKRHIELSGNKSQNSRRTIWYDGELDAVEIRQALFPVVRIAGELDRFVGLEFNELERTGADRFGAHVAGRNVARINRRIAGGEQCQ